MGGRNRRYFSGGGPSLVDFTVAIRIDLVLGSKITWFSLDRN